ncbi:winged helix-turn-helix transcriptional regulator [Candidatus Beckwithbacteria bacterium]|nr:winged helix-turn-helix transcriptional regulator [Candidatus Beckwithbacteria bacterium]
MDGITQALQKLNISPNETRIYLALLKNGPSSITELAKLVCIPRTTTHENSEKLIEKGLVSRTIIGARKKLIAEKPTKLELLLAEEKVKLKSQSQDISSIEKSLPKLISSIQNSVSDLEKNTDFDVKIYKGKSQIQKVYLDILKAIEIRAYCDSKGISEFFPENYDLFTKAHKENKQMIMWEIIIPPIDFYKIYLSKLDMKRYKYKLAPKNLKLPLSIDYLIYDQKVAVINLVENPTCIVINNQPFYQNAKSLFEFIWQMIPESTLF